MRHSSENKENLYLIHPTHINNNVEIPILDNNLSNVLQQKGNFLNFSFCAYIFLTTNPHKMTPSKS